MWKKLVFSLMFLILGVVLVTSTFTDTKFQSDQVGLEFQEPGYKTLNVSISKYANISYFGFNVTGSAYENVSDFNSGFGGWSCLSENSINANCSLDNNRIKLYYSIGFDPEDVAIARTYNLTQYEYIVFDYNSTGSISYFGFGSYPDGLVINISSGIGTITYYIGNRTGNTNLTFGIYGYVGSKTLYIDNIKLISYPNNIMIDMGNYSGSSELFIPGQLLNNDVKLIEDNNTKEKFNISFLSLTNKSVGIKIPKNAKITSATFNLTGLNRTILEPTTNWINATDGIAQIVFYNNTDPGNYPSNNNVDVRFDVIFPSGDMLVKNIQAHGVYNAGTDFEYDCDTVPETNFSSSGAIYDGSSQRVVCVLLSGTTGFADKTRIKMYYNSSDFDDFVYLVYNQTNEEYLSNLSLDIGADGTYEWYRLNNFSDVHNQTLDLKDNLTNYLNTCSFDSQNICTIPIELASSKTGIVTFEQVYINYTNATYTGNQTQLIREYFDIYCGSINDYNCTFPIKFTTDRIGNISLTNINLTYSILIPTLNITNPTQNETLPAQNFLLESTISNYTKSYCKYTLMNLDTAVKETENTTIACSGTEVTTGANGNYSVILYHKDNYGQEVQDLRNFSAIYGTIVITVPSGGGGGGASYTDVNTTGNIIPNQISKYMVFYPWSGYTVSDSVSLNSKLVPVSCKVDGIVKSCSVNETTGEVIATSEYTLDAGTNQILSNSSGNLYVYTDNNAILKIPVEYGIVNLNYYWETPASSDTGFSFFAMVSEDNIGYQSDSLWFFYDEDGNRLGVKVWWIVSLILLGGVIVYFIVSKRIQHNRKVNRIVRHNILIQRLEKALNKTSKNLEGEK